jgi:hypothetical protein
MDEDQLFLRPTKPPSTGIGEDAYRRAEDMAFIKVQLAQLPTVKQLCRFGVWSRSSFACLR